jgi:uncharacterized protein (TIGR03437 family)
MRVFLLLSTASVCFASNYSTYIGDAFEYRVSALTTDSAGNTFVTGQRNIGFNGFQQLTDVFVTKLDPGGNILFTSTFGGKAADSASGIAVDPTGNIWVSGVTTSPSFPLLGAIQNQPGLGQTGFVVRLNAAGAVTFSTYLGGLAGTSSLNAIAAAADGTVYVAGTTNSTDVSPNVSSDDIEQTSGALIARISNGGGLLSQRTVVGHAVECGCCSSCFLSARYTSASSISVIASGDVFIAGNTNTTDLPFTTGAKGIGAFVMKIGSTPAASYLTYIGSTNYVSSPFANPANSASSIVADAAGNAYLCGATSDPNFPATSSGYQRTWADSGTNNPFTPPSDAFVAKLNPQGSAMVWATYLGGKGADFARALAVNPAGEVWVGGQTQSPDFPATGSGTDFVARFDATGSILRFATRYPANTSSVALSVDQNGEVHAAGLTGVVWSGESASRIYGVGSAAAGLIAGRVAPGEVISIYGAGLASGTPVSFTPVLQNGQRYLPTALAGVSVSFPSANSANDSFAPLLYVSASQINAVVPFELSASSVNHMRITLAGVVTDFRVVVDPAIPEIFSNPDGSAAAINQDGSVNSAQNPAKAGSIVSFWATGTGAYFEAADGYIQTGAGTDCAICSVVLQNGLTLYGGAAPGMVSGITQFNLQLPAQILTPRIAVAVEAGPGLKVGDYASLYVAP